jgi:hypothetical protein
MSIGAGDTRTDLHVEVVMSGHFVCHRCAVEYRGVAVNNTGYASDTSGPDRRPVLSQRRHGPARPGHPIKARAVPDGPDEPGHDG